MTTAFDFNFEDIRGNHFPLSQFTGRPLVIVNTASKCGFTPQYTGLEDLWQARRAAGLIVVGVPCNDFGRQEPGDSAAIAAFSSEKYGVDFPLTAKCRVKGQEAHPLFHWLAREGGFFARPRWNFYKYLIRRDGYLDDWFASITPPTTARFQRAVDKIMKM